MAPPQRDDPYKAFNFIVEIDGIARAGFSEVSGLESETAVIEYRVGGERNAVRKLPGLTKYANIVLRRGVTQDAELSNWRKTVEDGQVDRRNGSIILRDDDGNDVGALELLQWLDLEVARAGAARQPERGRDRDDRDRARRARAGLRWTPPDPTTA